MGVHTEPEITTYWNTDFNKGPLHSIPSHITLCWFQQIKRYQICCQRDCSLNIQRYVFADIELLPIGGGASTGRAYHPIASVSREVRELYLSQPYLVVTNNAPLPVRYTWYKSLPKLASCLLRIQEFYCATYIGILYIQTSRITARLIRDGILSPFLECTVEPSLEG